MTQIILPTKPISGLSSTIAKGGVAQIVLPPLMVGGYIENPLSPDDQGISVIEPLYVSPVGPFEIGDTSTAVAILPGGRFIIVPNSTSPVWVNAETIGHRFKVYGETSANFPVAVPVPGDFPPTGPTTMTEVIGSYLYKEYDDDDDLQAWVASYNISAQIFIDTINSMNLPIYTQDQISGALLDWVALGLYGMIRPALFKGRGKFVGPLNTYTFNSAPPLNAVATIGPHDVVITTDDIFKRVLTWHFLKGDGKIFNVRWLKRRIMRFLIGEDGTNPNIDQTYQISVTFGVNNEVAIRFIDYTTKVPFSAIFNGFALNTAMFNECRVVSTPIDLLPFRDVFEEAIGTGALELPFQFTYDIVL